MQEITAKEVKEMLKENASIQLIDVREVEEVREGKIPGALHIPLGLLEARMHELDQAIPYTVVCLSGGRSSQAVRFLESYGFEVTNMTGGMLAWEGPTE